MPAGTALRPSNGYIRVVYNHPDSLQVSAHDFIVRFPAGTSISEREYMTIAFEARKFFARYGVKPDFEILDTDSEVPDMVKIKIGPGRPGFEDVQDLALLFRWDGASDLVEDVDYAFWGATGMVDKSQVSIDGLDRNSKSDSSASNYLRETKITDQKPIAKALHPLLKSWQRRQNPREFGEIPGGNSTTGQDEMSEDLRTAFRSEVPSPEEFSGALDLFAILTEDSLRANGKPNRVINPGELISVSVSFVNLGLVPTGELHTRLRTSEPLVTMLDSVAVIAGIGATDTSDFSRDVYVFSVDSVALPDTLRFKLTVYSKPNAVEPAKNRDPFIADAPIDEFEIGLAARNAFFETFFTVRPQVVTRPSDRGAQQQQNLRIVHRLFSALDPNNPGSQRVNDLTASLEYDGTIFQEVREKLNDYATLEAGDSSDVMTFTLVAKANLQSLLRPPQIVFKFQWGEQVPNPFDPSRDTTITRSSPDTVKWDRLGFKTFALAGTIKSMVGRPVPGARVLLENAKSIRIDTTDGSGSFTFSLTDTGAYTLSALRFGVPEGAIDRDDTTTAKKFIDYDFISEWKEVCKKLQMSTNLVINASDTAAIGKKIGNPCATLPIGRQWVFIDANVSDITPAKLPTRTNLNLQYFNLGSLNFTGILYGDVNGNVDASKLNENTANCPKFEIAVKYNTLMWIPQRLKMPWSN
jgi:hypothetical protein